MYYLIALSLFRASYRRITSPTSEYGSDRGVFMDGMRNTRLHDSRQPDSCSRFEPETARSVAMVIARPRRSLYDILTGPKVVKKFSTFYGTRRFITAFISTRHFSLF